MSFDYRHYFAKMFLIYEVGFEWDLKGMGVIEKRQFLRDMMHMRREYDDGKLLG